MVPPVFPQVYFQLLCNTRASSTSIFILPLFLPKLLAGDLALTSFFLIFYLSFFQGLDCFYELKSTLPIIVIPTMLPRSSTNIILFISLSLTSITRSVLLYFCCQIDTKDNTDEQLAERWKLSRRMTEKVFGQSLDGGTPV